MKLFKHSQGFIIAFGFDMIHQMEAPRVIAWNDPTSGKWQPSVANLAGKMEMSFTVAPEFVFEQGGRIIAYQPGKCIEMTFIGGPYVWRVTTLQSDLQISEVA